MPTSFFGQRIIHLESVDSTNNYTAKVFKSGEVKAGSVIMADIQTDGRGQREKTWQSGAFENLTFSLTADINLWKINTLIDLNRLIAISLYNFFSDLGFDPKIKWPNDIMIENKKVCGILIENFFRDGVAKSIIGIGINVNQKEFDFPRATSMSLIKNQNFQTKELLYKFINVLNETFNSTPLSNSQTIHKRYDDLLWKKNINHEFTTSPKEIVFGEIKGTTLEGDLAVSFNKSISTFRNGEVTY